MDARIPELIQPLLTEYLSLIETRLPGFMTACYIHGSIALAAFNPHLSDIDFVALISRPASPQECDHLRTLHRTLAAKYPRWALEGIYLQPDDLASSTPTLAPTHHDGNLHLSTDFERSEVTWWLLKNRGIALLGTQPHNLPFTVDWDVLVSNMKHNLNTYWASYTTNPRRMIWLSSDYGIQWAVLGVLRQFYTFKEHDITSKTGAGEYALNHLPPRWHRLIHEAINLRQQSGDKLYNNRLVRAYDALQFLRMIIRLCNTLPG